MYRTAIILVCLATFLVGACAPRYVTPPPVPAKELPVLMQDPPPQPPNTGRVYLDVTNGPTEIVEIMSKSSGFATSGGYSASSYGESTRHVCRTPCAADFSYGSHELRIGLDLVTIEVGVKATAYRHTLGFYDASFGKTFWGIMAASLGGSGVVTGGALAAVGIGAGLPILVISGVVTALGLWLMKSGRTVIQKGSGVQWVIE